MQKPPDHLQQRGLKLSHLRMLAALKETGQISLAADRIGIRQPAASRLLSEIERVSEMPVHIRTGRGITLTPVGEALARRAQRVQRELRDAARDMADVTAGASGHIRLGAVTGPALDRVLPALRNLRIANPSVTAGVTVATSDVLTQQLLNGKLDFAIGRLPETADRALLEFKLMASEPVVLVVRREHPLRGRDVLLPPDLMTYDWVMPGETSILTRTVMAALRAHGLPHPPQRISTASFLLTLALLQQSNAIAPLATAVAQIFARADDAPYAVLPIDLGITVEPYGLLVPAGMALTPVAQRLADSLLAMPPQLGGHTTFNV